MVEYADIIIVGAGPAGMEAAIAARKNGASVVIIDRYSRPGGQYFKRMPKSFCLHSDTPHDRQAEQLLRTLEDSGARILTDTTVWNIEAEANTQNWRVFLAGENTPSELLGRAVILATGAYDRPIAFPGWTLPGVLSSGAVQTLLKSQRVLPGKRFLVSGTGPLQLAVAAQLVWAGADIAGVYEGARLGLRALRHIPVLWGQWERLCEGFLYMGTLLKAKVPYKTGWSVIEARGDGKVEEVVVARLDAEWKPIPGSEQTHTVDTLVVGYGFQPINDLARLVGCAHDCHTASGGLVPRRNALMETTIPGIYAVGDGTGIGGATLSRMEGRVAGLGAAYGLGFLRQEEVHAALARERKTLLQEQRFARFLGEMFTPGAGMYMLAKQNTIICRCEEITLGEIEQAIEAGCDSLSLVKRMTRAGMGPCQGHICGQLAARILNENRGYAPQRLKSATVRAPVLPVPLTLLAKGGE